MQKTYFQFRVVSCHHCPATLPPSMPILHRWDEHEAEGSGAAWRYDDSSSGQESAHGASDSSEWFGHTLVWLTTLLPIFFQHCLATFNVGFPLSPFFLLFNKSVRKHHNQILLPMDDQSWIQPRYGVSDETSSLSDGSECDLDLGASRDINFTLNRLESLHSLSFGEPGDEGQSQFASNGMCKKRIKEAVKNPGCQCKCKVPFSVLVKICVSFWSLCKQAQDALLWTLQSEGSHRQKNWHIEGGVYQTVPNIVSFLVPGQPQVISNTIVFP